MPGSDMKIEIKMEELTTKPDLKDTVLESKEVTRILRKEGMEFPDYPFRYSNQQPFHVNVDSSNLSSFIKIQRVREDAVFGLRQRRGREKYRRITSLDETQLGEESTSGAKGESDDRKLGSSYSLPVETTEEASNETDKINNGQQRSKNKRSKISGPSRKISTNSFSPEPSRKGMRFYITHTVLLFQLFQFYNCK